MEKILTGATDYPNLKSVSNVTKLHIILNVEASHTNILFAMLIVNSSTYLSVILF